MFSPGEDECGGNVLSGTCNLYMVMQLHSWRYTIEDEPITDEAKPSTCLELPRGSPSFSKAKA